MMDSYIDSPDKKTNTDFAKKLPSVSVCIPCIPVHVQYLPDCFLSILNQTMLPEEVILVVSESTLKVKEQVKSLIKQFPAFGKELIIKCQFFIEKNHPGINRNEAVKLATQDIILFIDADDLMCPVRVFTAKNIFFDHPNIVGFMNFFKKTMPEYDQEDDNQLQERTSKDCDALFKESLLWETPYDSRLIKPYEFTFQITFGQPNLKRSLFSEEGYSYNSKRIAEDVDFINSLLPKHGKNLLIYEKELTFYMQCRSSDSNTAENKKSLMFDISSDAPLTLNFRKEPLIFNPTALNITISINVSIETIETVPNKDNEKNHP
jgi:glycosyltransferase involved in cell wall biosynthesis